MPDDGTGAVRQAERIALLAILMIVVGEMACLLAGYAWHGSGSLF